MADGSTAIGPILDATTLDATLAMRARSYWLGLVGKAITFLFEATPTEAAGELDMLLLVPSTPTSRARAERVKAAVRSAAREHRNPAMPFVFAASAQVAVIEAARRAVGPVRSAQQLAAAFGLDIRLFAWKGDERLRGAFAAPWLNFHDADLGVQSDAPTLALPMTIGREEFVEQVAWACGAMVLHWLGDHTSGWVGVGLAKQIGRALAIRDEDVARPMLLEAFWPYSIVDGDITDASMEAASTEIRAACAEVAERLEGLATTEMVYQLVLTQSSSSLWRSSVHAAALHVCGRSAPATTSTAIGEAA